MKAIYKLRLLLVALLVVCFVACRSGRPRMGNTGTAHDRTGTNGATVGNGKAPSGNAHGYRY